MVRKTPPPQLQLWSGPYHLSELDALVTSKDHFSAWLSESRTFIPTGQASAPFDPMPCPSSLQYLLSQISLTGMVIFSSATRSPSIFHQSQTSLSGILAPEKSKYFRLSCTARPGWHTFYQPSSAARGPIFSPPWTTGSRARARLWHPSVALEG